MGVLRTIGPAIIGYLVFGISAGLLFAVTGRDPHAAAPVGFMIWTTLYGMVFGAAGGYLAARLGARRPRAHALAVSVIIAVGALASLLLSPGSGGIWSQTAAILFMAPAAVGGGRFAERRTVPDP
jgi:hypothetical protein